MGKLATAPVGEASTHGVKLAVSREKYANKARPDTWEARSRRPTALCQCRSWRHGGGTEATESANQDAEIKEGGLRSGFLFHGMYMVDVDSILDPAVKPG